MKKLFTSILFVSTFLGLHSQDLKDAMINGNLESIKVFIEKGNGLDDLHIGGRYTLLCAGVKVGNVKIVSYLLEQGASTKALSNGKTPLMYAAKYGRLEIAKILLKNGTNIDFENARGVSALDYARKYDQSELVTFFGQ